MSATVVYVRLESGRIRQVDSSPLPPQRFGNGHLWMFDGGVSDVEDPYTCGLCGQSKWRSYNTPCAEGRTPDDLNAERAQWIADHRFHGLVPHYLREDIGVAA
ncbi:hypothetical protein [Streptantibioticus silvisoli]|uniref:Uncharacterized protein n=1 Tax=Streptantibioticus silvisoli TaxID=2705255 RepID=A0ABT6W5P1_9ACTN|nr:hypothetical protein [Streptantibioticus silvisoli]MDI5964836.1 hypothetical protein [Streptantibioticus silvisoli]